METTYFEVFRALNRFKYTIGKHLKTLRDTEDYKKLSGLESWFDFLAQPEIDLTAQEANKLISNYEFIVSNNLPQDISSRRISLLKKISNPIEIYNETALLSYKDMKERIVDLDNEKSGKSNTRTYKYVIMRKCLETGTLEKVNGVESPEILNTFKINEDGIRYE
jgi:hypothetical protein